MAKKLYIVPRSSGFGSHAAYYEDDNKRTSILPSGGSALNTASGGSRWQSTEAQDTASFIGYPGFPGINGQFVSTEAQDVFTGTGYPALQFTIALSEAKDLFSAFLLQPVSGTWGSTEAKDRFAGTGVGFGVTLTWASTEAKDVFSASGVAVHPTNGPWVSTEAADVFRARGAGAQPTTSRPDVFFVS